MPDRPHSPWPALLLGALIVGSLDALFAVVFWKIGYGTPPGRIFQSIAAGLLGPASFEGGMATAWLGAVLHYGIATAIVLVYYAAGFRMPALVKRPVPYGLTYGLAVYVVMNYIVVPLSAAMPGNDNPVWIAGGILIHAVGIGLPAALFSRRARTDTTHQ